MKYKLQIFIISLIWLGVCSLPSVLYAHAGRLQETVNACVRDLDNPEVKERDMAESEIISLGVPALKCLPEPNSVRMKRLSPEAQLRLGRIWLILQRKESEQFLDASHVTIPDKEMTLREILAHLKQETGNDIRDAHLTPSIRKYRLPVENVSFWSAVELLRIQGRQAVTSVPDVPALVLDDMDVVPTPAFINGPLRLEPMRLVLQRSFTGGGDTLSLQLNIMWEPRLRPIYMQVSFPSAVLRPVGSAEEEDVRNEEKTEIMKENEIPLKPPVTEQEFPVGINATSCLLDVPFKMSGVPRASQEFYGRCQIRTVWAGGELPFIFTNLDKKLGQEFKPDVHRAAGVLVTLSGLRREEDYLVATLRYRYEETYGAMESHRTWIYENTAVLSGMEGEDVKSVKFEMLRQTENEIALDFYFPFPSDLKGKTLKYARPSAIFQREYTIPISGRSLALP